MRMAGNSIYGRFLFILKLIALVFGVNIVWPVMSSSTRCLEFYFRGDVYGPIAIICLFLTATSIGLVHFFFERKKDLVQKVDATLNFCQGLLMIIGVAFWIEGVIVTFVNADCEGDVPSDEAAIFYTRIGLPTVLGLANVLIFFYIGIFDLCRVLRT